MKRRLRNIPKNKFGALDATDLLTGVGQLGMSVTQAAQNSTTNGVNAGNTIGSMLNSAAIGAQVGSMFGPIGTGVGAAVGGLASGIASLVGRKGSVDSITGEITKGSGIKSRRGPSYNELMRRSLDIRQNNSYREYNNTAAYNWYLDNGYNGYTLAAKGGVIPNALAYVDDGELLRTPDGTIINIPELGKPTDSNLVSVPEGTQVLSDKLKVPGTKQTFAEAGKKLIRKQKYGNDVYAKNSEMLNNMNNLIAYSKLLDLQEDMKTKKGIKDKVGKYSDGNRRIRNVQSTANYNTDIYGTDPYWDAWSTINLNNYQNANAMLQRYHNLGLYNAGEYVNYRPEVADYQTLFNTTFNPINQQIGNLRLNKTIVGRGGTTDNPTLWLSDGYAGYQTALRHLGRNADAKQLTNINARLFARGLEAYNDPETGMVLTRPIDRMNMTNVPKDDLRDLRAKQVPESRTSLADLADTSSITTIPKNPVTSSAGGSNLNIDLSGVLNNIDPIISSISSLWANTQNARDLEPEQVPPRYTRAYFSPVEYNINPLLEEINRTNAITRYNQTQIAPRTGANLAYGIQSAVARNRAINEAYNNQRNINNLTRARNAQMAAGVSQYNAQAQHTADVENAQNREQARNLRRQYRSANATIIPSILRDIRLNRRDLALLEYMRPFLEYGSTDEAVANLKRGMR